MLDMFVGHPFGVEPIFTGDGNEFNRWLSCDFNLLLCPYIESS